MHNSRLAEPTFNHDKQRLDEKDKYKYERNGNHGRNNTRTPKETYYSTFKSNQTAYSIKVYVKYGKLF